jgi:hypothetical protein
LDLFCDPDGIDLHAPEIARGANLPPAAVIDEASHVDGTYCDGSVCYPRWLWTLDASTSSDPEGGALTYRWDIGGTVLESQSAIAQLITNPIIISCQSPGPCWLVRLRVTDPAGGVDETGQ